MAVLKEELNTKYFSSIMKRDGRGVPFNEGKITDAIYKAFDATGEGDRREAIKLTVAYAVN